MAKYLARIGSAWVQTRGSGAGAVAPLAPENDPAPEAYDANDVFLGTPVAQTYPAGVFSVVGRVSVAVPFHFPLLIMQITAPNGERRDAGFVAEVDVEDSYVVRALDQKATATGTWTARLGYSTDAGATYTLSAARSFTISSLT